MEINVRLIVYVYGVNQEPLLILTQDVISKICYYLQNTFYDNFFSRILFLLSANNDEKEKKGKSSHRSNRPRCSHCRNFDKYYKVKCIYITNAKHFEGQ